MSRVRQHGAFSWARRSRRSTARVHPSTKLPPSVRHASGEASCAFCVHVYICIYTHTYTHTFTSLLRPAKARLNAMTRALLPAGFYDVRSSYCRHTFNDRKHARERGHGGLVAPRQQALLLFRSMLFWSLVLRQSIDIDKNSSLTFRFIAIAWERKWILLNILLKRPDTPNFRWYLWEVISVSNGCWNLTICRKFEGGLNL